MNCCAADIVTFAITVNNDVTVTSISYSNAISIIVAANTGGIYATIIYISIPTRAAIIAVVTGYS